MLNEAAQVLLEMLIEELHNHLYLKSFYCDVRWKFYSRGQTQCESPSCDSQAAGMLT